MDVEFIEYSTILCFNKYFAGKYIKEYIVHFTAQHGFST